MADPSPGTPEERPETLREWLILLLRDLAVLAIVVAIAFGALFAYAGVWPPMVVVESGSMQHSDTESFVGVIDTGDYVLVQASPFRGQIASWIEGRVLRYTTYGDFGDVIVFWPPGPRDKPVIHRALIYLQWNTTTDDGWDAPSLLSLSNPEEWSATDRMGFPLPGPYNINGRIFLHHTTFRGNGDHTISLTSLPTRVSGFVTMGDNNAVRPGGGPDPWLIPQDAIIGRARGELPWFGLLKLTIAPESTCCQGWGDARAPRNSWDALAMSLVVIIVAPLVADFGVSWWMKRRKVSSRLAAGSSEAAEPSPGEGDLSGTAENPALDPTEPPPEGPSH